MTEQDVKHDLYQFLMWCVNTGNFEAIELLEDGMKEIRKGNTDGEKRNIEELL